MRLIHLFLGCGLLMVAGCSAGEGEGDELPAPEEWEGATAHLVAVGELEGESIALELRDADAENTEKLFCERNYIVPNVDDPATWSEGYLEKVELKWFATVEGIEREYEITFAGHDFSASQDGAQLSVKAFDDEAALDAASVMSAVKWQYESEGSEIEVEAVSESGSFVRGVFSGTPGADGVVIPDGEGRFGGYLHLSWADGDVLDVSFSAACGENDMDTP